MFSHQKLSVYRKAVIVAADLERLAASWDKRHSVVDQLERASESVVLNLVEAVRLRSVPAKECTIDYGIGSALECAACLDIAVVKGLLGAVTGWEEKLRLCEVVKMLFGLRKSWVQGECREEPADYGGPPLKPNRALFGHEQLEVYRTALQFVVWFDQLLRVQPVCLRSDRKVDKAATSMVLNIAEGNGRRGADDRQRFRNMAEASAVKVAAYLDLASCRDELAPVQAKAGCERLELVVRLLQGFGPGT